MKKIIITCAVLAITAAGAFAQNSRQAITTPGQPQPVTPLTRPQSDVTPEQRVQQFAENQARAFERQYSMTPEQYKKMYAACLEFTNKMESQRTTGKQPTQQEFEAIMAEKDAKFKKIMTTDQFAKYESTRRRPVPQTSAQQTPIRK
ncbi:MAG: hypothetical protein H7257_12375 [Taibaiella sp.]|nr:hypothetical protein [Taibaiella sp.]